MLGNISKAEHIYLACGYTDMRNPFSNNLFLFCGRKRNRLKALYWEGDGFVLLYRS